MKRLLAALTIFWPILAWADEPICITYSGQTQTKESMTAQRLEVSRSPEALVHAAPADFVVNNLGAPGVLPPSKPASTTPAQPPLCLQNTCPASSYDWQDGSGLDQYPQSAMGILIFEMADGGLGSCSASLVSPNLVLTAGHCLYWNGAPHTKMRFVPGYRDNSAPHGTYAAVKGWIWQSWAEETNWGRDVAIVRLKDDLGDRFGWLGLAYNHDPTEVSWLQFGYPSANQFQNAKRLVQSLSSYGFRANCGSPNPMAVGSAHTSGSSGGPWILNKSDGPYVNGINSAHLIECPQTMISPIFDDSILTLYETAQNN